MIKKKGTFTVHEEGSDINELLDSVDTLPNGTYNYLLYDNKKNRSLPQLKYLFGVVLKTISDELPNRPPVDALYRYFEEQFAPVHTCEVSGHRFDYRDLKNEKSIEMNDVITKVIHHAEQHWGIKVPDSDIIKSPSAQELYIGAYAEMWRNYLDT
jgi:hypothetical protein